MFLGQVVDSLEIHVFCDGQKVLQMCLNSDCNVDYRARIVKGSLLLLVLQSWGWVVLDRLCYFYERNDSYSRECASTEQSL